MQKIFNRLLFMILLLLLGLLGYKTLISPNVAIAEAVTTVSEKRVVVNSPANSKEEIEAIVKDYLMENPEVIISAIENWQKRKMQENQQKLEERLQEKKSDLENTQASPILGSPDGRSIIVVFFDYNCGYCKKGDYNLRELIEEDKDVKVVLRPLPILGDMSVYSAKVALAVFITAPDKFLSVHRELMEMKQATHESIATMLTNHSLNVDEINKVMESKEVNSTLQHNFALANDLKIKGAPAYIINSKMFPGLMDVTQLKDAIAKTIVKDESKDKAKELLPTPDQPEAATLNK